MVTKKGLLELWKPLKEIRGILHGHKIKVYTDHEDLGRKNSIATLQRTMRWIVLLEAFGPNNEHIKRVHDTVDNIMYSNIKQHVFFHEIVYEHKTIQTAPQKVSQMQQRIYSCGWKKAFSYLTWDMAHVQNGEQSCKTCEHTSLKQKVEIQNKVISDVEVLPTKI